MQKVNYSCAELSKENRNLVKMLIALSIREKQIK